MRFTKWQFWLLQIWIAVDQTACAMLGGWADETLSAYALRLEMRGSRWGALWRRTIDWLFYRLFKQEKHCEKALLEWYQRAAKAPQYRSYP